MRKEARLLLGKAINGLVAGIETFNRPVDMGRSDHTLMLLDHAFEMLLKAAIVHKGGKIFDGTSGKSIGFDKCVRLGLSSGKVKFLTDEQVLTLQVINESRDAAQHYLLLVSEQLFYTQVQAGVTLFRDILLEVFGIELTTRIPQRVMPVSVEPPVDLVTLFDHEVDAIKKLLAPGRRRKTEAEARIRPLAIVQKALEGQTDQPTPRDIADLAAKIGAGQPTAQLFPGVVSLRVVVDGSGPAVRLRFTTKAGVPIHTVPEGTPGAYPVGIKRVDELGFYSLGFQELASHVGLSSSRLTAVVKHLSLKDDPECYKEFSFGKTKHGRYSQKAIPLIRNVMQRSGEVERVWSEYRRSLGVRRTMARGAREPK